MLFRTSIATPYYVTFILFSTLVPQSTGLNVLFVNIGYASHVTSAFELAKAMKNHNITFLTHQLAKSYIDLDSVSSPLFRTIYPNDSVDASSYEKNLEQSIFRCLANQSLLEALPKALLTLGDAITQLLNKTVHILMSDRFDVIIAGETVKGMPILCEKIQTPCVIHTLVAYPDFFDLNIPHRLSFLAPKQLTQLSYRLYNAIFNIRFAIKMIPKMIPTFYTIFQSLPQIPGPFYDSFTVKNLLSSKSKCLYLVSKPPTFDTPTYSNHYIKYLGVFIEETSVVDPNDTLAAWIKPKQISSILFGSFGSSSLIPYNRMYNLMSGLGKFLLQTADTFLLLALRNANYDTYKAVLKDLSDNEIRSILENKQRVWIEKGFVKQKWILEQKSIKVFLSHCGMGSLSEGLYFGKPILCMPFSSEQFSNGVTIKNRNVGQTLFEPPSLTENLRNPYDVVHYIFTAESVTSKIFDLWTNVACEKAVREMSLEMKHAGGVKRAVEEIEFFVNLGGDLDRFTPFQNTLPFYQRYMLDLLLVFVILPGVIITCIVSKCCKRQQKTKIE